MRIVERDRKGRVKLPVDGGVDLDTEQLCR